MIKKIRIQHLAVGMYIADLNNQWIPANNATRRGYIRNEATISKIRNLGVSELFIDTSKGIDSSHAEDVDAAKKLQSAQFESLRMQAGFEPNRRPVEEERDRAEKNYSQAKVMVNNVLDEIKQGNSIDPDAVEEGAQGILESLKANENALSALSHIRSKDEYLLHHSVNVGLLLGIFSRAKRFDEDITLQLISGGLLHDIGKILVPDEVLNKPGKLEDDEWEEMKRHVTYGEQILDITPGLTEATRSICKLHHERMDGTGYPRNLKGDEISLYGRMAAICDVYDAVTADRVYHEGLPPDEAMRKLIEWSVFHLDKELVYEFIRALSTFPVGTLVELTNGRAGVVIEANRRQPKEPKVKLFYNTRHEHQIEPTIVDLSKMNQPVEILNTLDTRAFKIDIRPFL